MPNWCSNSITIQGSTDTLKPLWEQAQTNWKNEDYGLLNAMVPMPQELKGTSSPSDTPNWYDWCVENWGTKWDIDDQGLEFTDNGDGTASITGWFESAWAPPIAAYNTFLDDNDGCSLYSSYEEGGMDFAGIYEDGDDDYMENLSEACEAIVRGTETLDEQSELFRRLDDEFDLVENRREYIEEQIEEEKAEETA